MHKLLLYPFLLLPLWAYAQCDPVAIFSNLTTNAVCIEADEKVRTIYTNNLPNHTYGTWPSNNPVDPQEFTFKICAFPQKAETFTSIYDSGDIIGCSQYIEFGVGANGIRMAPFGARWFVNPNTQEENLDWNIEALVLFNMDFNNSHSNGRGEYHYHGIPESYFSDSLHIDGSAHSPVVGYAADGFPIYYKYLYSDPNNPDMGISAFSSGYTLKPGNRPGDGITAPDGAHDGLYVEDYEYLNSTWELDECNGRFGITPEYPEGTYYYVMTDNWPYIPRCFYGTVIDNSFRIGPNCPASIAEEDCSEAVVNTTEPINATRLLVTPNPASTTINLTLDNPSLGHQITQVSIYDLKGQLWYLAQAYQAPISIAEFPNGNYFLQVNFGKIQVTKKIVVQR